MFCVMMGVNAVMLSSAVRALHADDSLKSTVMTTSINFVSYFCLLVVWRGLSRRGGLALSLYFLESASYRRESQLEWTMVRKQNKNRRLKQTTINNKSAEIIVSSLDYFYTNASS